MEWRDISGYEGVYLVSEQGDVQRCAPARGTRPGRMLALSPHKQGYRTVTLYQRNQGRRFLVHCLVARAFLGPCPVGKEVNHIDGVKHHNERTNLEYLTRPENIQHARDTGLNDMRGEGNAQSRLVAAQVIEIRRAHAAGEAGYKALAATYGVTWECIRNIVKGRTWRHLLPTSAGVTASSAMARPSRNNSSATPLTSASILATRN